MDEVGAALQTVCREQAGSSLEEMAAALMTSFFAAKMKDPKAGVALYSVSSDVDGAKITRKMSLSVKRAIVAMLATAKDELTTDPELVASMLQATMAGVSRQMLESASRVPPVPSNWGPGMEALRRPNFSVGVFSQCMKGQRIRYQQTGEFHFLTFSSFRRQPYLSPVAAMELFEDALERVRLRYLFAVAGYVVMPEHVHLLVNEPGRGLLSRTVQALKLSVSMRSRERPFWQAHYYDFNVSSHQKFVEKLRYIHRNPVKRGLVTKPEEWLWSSYRHYQTGMHGTVEIESEWTAYARGWQLPEWMRNRQLNSPSPAPLT
jgi:putative transposase